MKVFFLIMKKYRINLTVEDYFDYVGTNPLYSRKERMLYSLPETFRKGVYNIKFKTLKRWTTYYRVHLSLITTEEKIKEVIEECKTMSHYCGNISYKEINKI